MLAHHDLAGAGFLLPLGMGGRRTSVQEPLGVVGEELVQSDTEFPGFKALSLCIVSYQI